MQRNFTPLEQWRKDPANIVAGFKRHRERDQPDNVAFLQSIARIPAGGGDERDKNQKYEFGNLLGHSDGQLDLSKSSSQRLLCRDTKCHLCCHQTGDASLRMYHLTKNVRPPRRRTRVMWLTRPMQRNTLCKYCSSLPWPVCACMFMLEGVIWVYNHATAMWARVMDGRCCSDEHEASTRNCFASPFIHSTTLSNNWWRFLYVHVTHLEQAVRQLTHCGDPGC